MTTHIIMPQGGQDITEGLVASWLVAEGDLLKKGEIVCEVETEKAVFEVESPVDGVLLKIIAQEGDKVPILSIIGIVGKSDETIDLEMLPGEKKETDKGIDVSEIRERVKARGKDEKSGVKASGRAKTIAHGKDVDLTKVQGTGPQGRITEKDVLSYIEQQKKISAPPSSLNARVDDDRKKIVPMSKVRRVIAQRMLQSKQNAPHFYVTVSVEMTKALKARDRLNRGDKNAISLNDMLIRATALALEEFYTVNCIIEGDNIVYLRDINIGLAVNLDSGLVVPVLTRADRRHLKEIARETKRLIDLAKSGKQATLAPGTFTISNMGMLDVENFVGIINPPESAILAVGTTEKKVIVTRDGDIRISDIMKMTLSIDHRAIDGATAAKFVNKIKYHLQNPKTLLS